MGLRTILTDPHMEGKNMKNEVATLRCYLQPVLHEILARINMELKFYRRLH